MDLDFRESATYRMRAAAAALGCGICGGLIPDPISGGEPFMSGPYQGRYWCPSCWVLYYHDHPEHLADEATKRFIAKEAEEIRRQRGWEILFEESDNRIYLTGRGTLLFRMAPREGYGAGEYHPDDFQLLLRAIAEVERKAIPGFTPIQIA